MSPPEINVDQLMHQIRQAVAQRANGKGGKMESAPTAAPEEAAAGQIDGSRLALQPDFQPSTNGYHVEDLLQYHGETFVRNAYRAILKRDPDRAGMSNQLASLAGGRFNKIDVLASLRSSAEGKRAGVKISGLTWPVTIRRLQRIPVIGYLVELAVALLRLPVLLRHQRQYEFYALSRQEQIVSYVDSVKREVVSKANETSAAIENSISVQREALKSLQVEVNAALITLRDEIAAHNAALMALRDEVTASNAALGNLEVRTIERVTEVDERARSRFADQATLLQTLTSEKTRLVASLGLQEKRLADLFERAQLQSGLNEEGLAELYAAFEDQFRGPYEEIKDRLRVYLPIFERAKVTTDILDVGCGRGEWLELLRETGMQARGVDDNRIFIERCRQKGLDVVEAEAIAYLRELPDASLNAATSFHLVEHLPFKTLLTLLDEFVRVLRPGAPLILETPNPANFTVGSHTFYTDPTHRNPIPSMTLRFLLEARGLKNVEVMNVRPQDEAKIAGDDELTKRFNAYFFASPDYGIVGWKN